MALLKNAKSFLMKEDYDFDRPDFDLYNFHPQLRLIYIANGIFFKNKESSVRFIIPLIHSGIMFATVGIQSVLFYHGITTGDYAIAAEAFCYLVVCIPVPIIYCSFFRNKDFILRKVYEMNKDFELIRTLSTLYRDKFLKGQLIIWQGCWAWAFVCTCAGFFYIFSGYGQLLYYATLATHNENTKRPLIFPVYLPYDDPHRSPNYELFMFFQTYIVFIVTIGFAGYVYLMFHTLLHYYVMVDMMKMDLEVIFEGLDDSVVALSKYHPRRMEVQAVLNSRLKRIVKWHNSVFGGMDLVSSVFGPVLAYQVLVSASLICVVAYEIVVSIENGDINYFFFVFWTEGILQLWIPCYLGTLVRDQALSIADACWGCGWDKTPLSRLIRDDLINIILVAQKPLTIKFTGLPTLSLETFSSIMTTAYSYFNMLRQTS